MCTLGVSDRNVDARECLFAIASEFVKSSPYKCVVGTRTDRHNTNAMKISQLEITNFRGITKGKISLPDHGVLFGPNNVGKSTIIEAIALLFERDRLIRQLSDWDFSGGLPRPDSRIHIVAVITDFGDPSQDEPHRFPKWFSEDAGRPIWWCRENQSVSVAIDPPPDSQLAVQVALSIRFDEEECEFETIRYFYDGPCDPFTDSVRKVPSECLQQLGVFLLPSNRQWEKLMSFGSSSLLKVLKSADAIPGSQIEALKTELRAPTTKIEDAAPLSEILRQAEEELQGFLMLERGSRLVYRPTSLDSLSVLQSLVPHVQHINGLQLPFARHGSGMVSLQAFLIVLAFAELRRKQGKNFILAAEEPELHLHPSLHRKLVNRIRAVSAQSLITTHSPIVAASYQPVSALFIQNDSGVLKGSSLKPGASITKNAIKRLYREKREALYEALMGASLLLPEGETDFEWIRLWQRIAESSDVVAQNCLLSPFTVLPTQDSAVVDTFEEISRFRTDGVPIVDGDCEGEGYLAALEKLSIKPQRVIQYGTSAAVECLSAWIIEPCLSNPGTTLRALLPDVAKRGLKDLQNELIAIKKDRLRRENLAWECAETDESALRAGSFIEDVGRISAGSTPNMSMWQSKRVHSIEIFTASEVKRV